jgi:hypothetical protein
MAIKSIIGSLFLWCAACSANVVPSNDASPTTCDILDSRVSNAAPNEVCPTVEANGDYDLWSCATPFPSTVPAVYRNCAKLSSNAYCCPSYE